MIRYWMVSPFIAVAALISRYIAESWWPRDAQSAAAWISAVAALATVVTAVVMFMAARRANQATAHIGAIERERWHVERAPEFHITATPNLGLSVRLQIELIGPSFLDHLDGMTAQLRDDRVGVKNYEPLEGQDHVLGYYCFSDRTPQPQACSIDTARGRTAATVRMELGDAIDFYLIPNRPTWLVPDYQGLFRKTYRNRPLRLALRCERGGEQWIVYQDVPTPDMGPAEPSSLPPEERG